MSMAIVSIAHATICAESIGPVSQRQDGGARVDDIWAIHFHHLFIDTVYTVPDTVSRDLTWEHGLQLQRDCG